MPSGRPPTGPKQVHKLDANQEAKRRLEVILETVSGDKSIAQACQELQICEARFHVIRKRALQAAVERLEPGLTGRPSRRENPQAKRIAELEQELQRKEIELRAAEVRTELALSMPFVFERTEADTERGKKTKARLKRRRRGRHRTRR